MTGPPDNNSKARRGLRERAEAAWEARHRDLAATSPEDLARVIHDLEVHQIELELQNEELRLTQIELEESRQQFSDLSDFAPVGYLMINQDAVIEQANLTVATMLGVERLRLIGQRFTWFLSGKSQNALHVAQRAMSHDNPSWRGELVVRRADGSELPVSMEMVEVVGSSPPLWRCVITDIIERKETEAVQHRLHQLALLPLDAAKMEDVLGAIVNTAIAITQADFGNIQLVEPGSSDLKIAAQRGFPQWWIDYWNTVSKGRGACGTALERGERVIVEDVDQSPMFTGTDLEMQRKASVRAVQSTPLVSRLGKLIGVVSTHYKTLHRPDTRTLLLLDLVAREAADIIAQAQSEAELKRQSALLDLAHSSILVHDPEGRIVYWNESAAQCYGWSKEEALGRVVHTLLQTQFSEPLERILDVVKRTGRWEGELVHTRRDGRRITIDSRWAIQRDAEGQGFRILQINNDITERVRLLEAEQQARTEAEKANRSKDVFLATVSHELRTPLNAMRGWAQMLREGILPPDRVPNAIAAINRNADLMKILVEDLVEVSRLATGNLRLDREYVNIVSLVRESMTLLESAARAQNIALESNIESEPMMVNGDPTRLLQILWNLLSNAIEFTPPEGRVALHVRSTGKEVEIRVVDSGQGIPSEFLPHVFEPFAQETGGLKGLGLGLAIVRQLVAAHEGHISVTSPGVGQGTTFTVLLPVAKAPAEALR